MDVACLVPWLEGEAVELYVAVFELDGMAFVHSQTMIDPSLAASS